MISALDLGAIHGSCVDFDGNSILAIGSSGSGKTSLALDLIALGAKLVSDDQVILSADNKGVHVSAPAAISGKIEARGIGILNCPNIDKSTLSMVVDLNSETKKRMPQEQTVRIGPHFVEVIAGRGVANLPIAIRLLTLFGRNQAVGSGM